MLSLLSGLFLPLVSFALGWNIVEKCFPDLSRWEKYLIAPGIGLFVIGLVAWGNFASGYSAILLNQIAWLAIALVIFIPVVKRIKNKKSETVKLPHLIHYRFIAFYLFLLVIQCALPVYRDGGWFGDWKMHYDHSLQLMGLQPIYKGEFGGYTIASRTPMLNLVAAFTMSLFGHSFAIFQVASTWCNSLVFLAIFGLSRKFTDEKNTILTLGFVFMNAALLHHTWYTWPK